MGTFNGTTQALDTGISNAVSANGMTMIVLCRGAVNGASGASEIYDGPLYSGASGIVWRHVSASYNSAFYIKGNNTYPAAKFSPDPLLANTWYVLAGTASSAGISAFVNGIRTGNTASGWGTGADAGNLFISRNPTEEFWAGDVAFALKIDRALTDAQIYELCKTPDSLWQVFQDTQRRIYVPSAGTGGGLSLAVDTAGAVAVAGQTATGSTNLAVGTAGAVGIAGQTATGTLNLAVSTAGAVAVAGQDVTFAKTENLSLAVDTAGAVTVSGQDVTVTVPQNLDLSVDAAGAVAVAGQTATGTLNLAVGTAGAVAVAGQTATQSLNLAVDTAGSITVAGQDVTVFYPTDLSLEIDTSGLITVAGQEVFFSGISVAAGQRPAGGKAKKRSRRKYVVEVDGQEFFVSSVEEAKELLQKAEEVAVEKAEQQIERSAKTVKSKRKAVQDARKALKLPDIRVVDAETDETAAAIEAQLRQTMDRIRQQYEQAIQAVEIGAYLRRKQEEEEDAIVTLLMHL
jgi:flagellar basal body rod protein FlgF